MLEMFWDHIMVSCKRADSFSKPRAPKIIPKWAKGVHRNLGGGEERHRAFHGHFDVTAGVIWGRAESPVLLLPLPLMTSWIPMGRTRGSVSMGLPSLGSLYLGDWFISERGQFQ